MTHCPCGATQLTALLDTPRASCLAPIPTCASACGKLHPCGHACPKTCHAGECGPCAETVSIVCRCGSQKATRRCGDVAPGQDEFLCERICRAMRACGRHACGRKCCPLAYQEALLAKSKSKRRPLADQFEAEQDPLGIHQCERVCGRKLSCGMHTCERNDHKGPCPPCLLAGFDECVS